MPEMAATPPYSSFVLFAKCHGEQNSRWVLFRCWGTDAKAPSRSKRRWRVSMMYFAILLVQVCHVGSCNFCHACLLSNISCNATPHFCRHSMQLSGLPQMRPSSAGNASLRLPFLTFQDLSDGLAGTHRTSCCSFMATTQMWSLCGELKFSTYAPAAAGHQHFMWN